MKRAREEEGKEGQGQGQAAPAAPVIWRPAAAATPSGTSQVTMDDAIDMVLSVKFAFNRAKYQEFLDVVRRINSIGLRGVVDRMKVLFRGHPNLKRQMNMFLPAEYRLSLSDDYQHAAAPAAAAGSLQGRQAQQGD